MIFPWIPLPAVWLPAAPLLPTTRLSSGFHDDNWPGCQGALLLASELRAVPGVQLGRCLGVVGPGPAQVAARSGPARGQGQPVPLLDAEFSGRQGDRLFPGEQGFLGRSRS